MNKTRNDVNNRIAIRYDTIHLLTHSNRLFSANLRRLYEKEEMNPKLELMVKI